jgi:hypothetical protein
VEKAYNPVSASVNVPSDGLIIPNLPPPPGESGTDWKLDFIPVQGSFTGLDLNSIPRSSATLTVEDGKATWSGPVTSIHIYLGQGNPATTAGLWGCGPDTEYNWFLPGEMTSSTNFHPGGWILANKFSNNATALTSYITTHFNNYIASLGGSTAATTGDLYAPNVAITGALIVTDPNNLDGSGNYDPNCGNMNVNLIAPKRNGDFNLTHSKIYEKILASSQTNTKIIVTTWEELK